MGLEADTCVPLRFEILNLFEMCTIFICNIKIALVKPHIHTWAPLYDLRDLGEEPCGASCYTNIFLCSIDRLDLE